MSQSTDENKAIVHRLHEALDARDLAALEGNPAMGEFRAMYARLLEAFLDVRFVAERLVAEGDWVAYHLTVRGTHRGSWGGITPTGSQITFAVDGMYRLAGVRVVDGHGQADLMEHLHRRAAALAPAGA